MSQRLRLISVTCREPRTASVVFLADRHDGAAAADDVVDFFYSASCPDVYAAFALIFASCLRLALSGMDSFDSQLQKLIPLLESKVYVGSLIPNTQTAVCR